MNKFIAIVIVIIILSACTDKKRMVQYETSTDSLVDTIKISTTSNRTFLIIEDRSRSNSLSNIKVQTQGFEIVNDTYEFGETDPLEATFIVDLDGNGFNELYFITRSVGSGSYAKIYGLASNRGKSVSQVYVNEDFKNEIFNGFQGHNEYKFSDGTLLNSFPVYNPGDPNSSPSGGNRSLEYQLSAGEASWILKPVRVKE